MAPRDSQTMPIIRALHTAGFAVLERPEGAPAYALATSGEFELVAWVTDVGRGLAGMRSLASISAAGAPLIALLAEATAEAVSGCLTAGADACLALDADERVVVAQAHAVLRRRVPAFTSEATLLQVGDLTVDSDRCEVERAGTTVALTASEFRIVEYMARNAGRVLRAHDILNAVTDDYEYQPREAQEVFKVYVRRIRRKLEPCEAEPRYLVTARGFGYRLEGGRPARTGAGAAANTA